MPNIGEMRMGSPQWGVANAGGVGENWQLSTNNSLYLEDGTRMHGFY